MGETYSIELPCKIGDMIYFFDQFEDEIYEELVEEITVCKGYFTIAGMDWKIEDFGKTVFLSREAAENALEDRIKFERTVKP